MSPAPANIPDFLKASTHLRGIIKSGRCIWGIIVLLVFMSMNLKQQLPLYMGKNCLHGIRLMLG